MIDDHTNKLLKMAFMLVLGFFFLFLGYSFIKNKGEPLMNWPLTGMLPSIFLYLHDPYKKITEVMTVTNLTFRYRGPWFSGTDVLLTADPVNVDYIMSKNFSNFPKGSRFRTIFDVMGDGIFNSDQDRWRSQRKTARELMSRPGFVRFRKSNNVEKLCGLLRILDYWSGRDVVVDLQDLLQRFTFDVTSIMVSGFDPRSLSVDLSDVPFVRAMDDVEEALIFRYVFPESVWKLMSRLNVGPERKLGGGRRELERIVREHVSQKRREFSDDGRVDMLSSFIGLGLDGDKFLRDAMVNFMIAGRDGVGAVLSWFFWLLCRNPNAMKKVRAEMEAIDYDHNKENELNKLSYLHAALCETMRLYPPVPFQHKSPLQPDVLPTGHRVGAGETILFSLYAMGRMRSIWGDDCLEFKPERWISENGGIRHEPSYKFLAFSAGPRTCIGKESAFTLMKMVVAAILGDYEIEVLEGHNVVPCLSIILHMKHGLMVKLIKRQS